MAERLPGKTGDWDGGAYAQVVWQLARQWFLGVRGDLIGLPEGQLTARTARGALSLTWQASEFARVRGYAEMEKGNISSDVGSLPAPALSRPLNRRARLSPHEVDVAVV